MKTERPEFADDEHQNTKTARQVVYVTFVEVRPLADCRVLDATEFVGALTMCFLPASSPDAALAKLQQRLDEEHLEIVSVEYCVNAASMDELDEEDTQRARKAGTENRVLFGNIVVWDDQGPDFE